MLSYTLFLLKMRVCHRWILIILFVVNIYSNLPWVVIGGKARRLSVGRGCQEAPQTSYSNCVRDLYLLTHVLFFLKAQWPHFPGFFVVVGQTDSRLTMIRSDTHLFHHALPLENKTCPCTILNGLHSPEPPSHAWAWQLDEPKVGGATEVRTLVSESPPEGEPPPARNTHSCMVSEEQFDQSSLWSHSTCW